MILHVIQECYKGLPDEPYVFLQRSAAVRHFVDRAKTLELSVDAADEVVAADELAGTPARWHYISSRGGTQELRWWVVESGPEL